MIKYLGSKRTLVPAIVGIVRSIPRTKTVVDLFSGTSRVGHALKRAGYRVLSNDHNAYAEVLARCYVEADRERVAAPASRLVREMNLLPGAPGYFTETFCRRSRFVQPKNGERIDAIREAIARKSLGPELEAVMLVSLMEAADRVDSTTGVQMAYLKGWAARSYNDIALRVPDVVPRARAGKGRAHRMDALEAAERLAGDAVYVDPPYNQHSYLGNYHVWESLVVWDKPEVYGTACKRVDVRERKSPFNRTHGCLAALTEIVGRVRAPVLIVSFNDEGYVSRAEMESLLATRGHVTVFPHDYKRYVGAQIGIYSPRGEKVGRVSHLRNTEYLYVVTPADARVARAGGRKPKPRRSRGSSQAPALR